MTRDERAVAILAEERKQLAPSVPLELILAVYRIEEQSQFDEDRREVPHRIRNEVQNVLDKESLKENTNGDAL